MMRNRREFLKGAVCAGGAAAMLGDRLYHVFRVDYAVAQSMVGFRVEPLKVRVGVIGVGTGRAVGRLRILGRGPAISVC